MTSRPHEIKTVLFDLDGTLADTAPDLAYALNAVLQEQGREILPFEHIRPVVSHGGIALIKHGFGIDETAAEFPLLRERLLTIYRENIARETRLFEGMEELLQQLESRGLNWGVVTNKPGWLTEPLLEELGVRQRAAAVVSGDTLPERKPHPAPMLLACEQSGSAAGQCLYVGDAERDIEAGRNAGMHTLIALFGYLGDDDHPEQWQADGMVKRALEILDWL
ncbi:MAG: HAD-IA family hydrolase [Gammaproteobacteria bacterium]|nr:HAD-IA family hydrolase [Gammaproteobacteria bacterium]MCW8927982.1 HAD-IA family hydrolase [Gammaproteobacteria bacterium]MCW8958417.1 HAD-IA family hydrolase [Gammaproteobacteria bacterium]MCW8973945.1 HAD-IA family hydrolase [Gammaproteobacteria bacterium]MCW8993061.1 HAD-IA family hydrolase [Gammaproteobacteria bacterium]